MIKNIGFPSNSATLPSNEASKTIQENIRSGSISVDMSPYKRGRTPSSQTRRKSTEPKSNFGIYRNPVVPNDTAPSFGKVKRKGSDIIEEVLVDDRRSCKYAVYLLNQT